MSEKVAWGRAALTSIHFSVRRVVLAAEGSALGEVALPELDLAMVSAPAVAEAASVPAHLVLNSAVCVSGPVSWAMELAGWLAAEAGAARLAALQPAERH